MEDCIFCKIVRGEIPAKVVLENEDVIAFDDVSPQAPIHTLIVPRVHYDSLSSDIPLEVLGKLLAAVAEVAEAKGVRDSGYRLVVNNGPDAKQSVQHLHLHVLGGKPMSHGMVRFDDEG